MVIWTFFTAFTGFKPVQHISGGLFLTIKKEEDIHYFPVLFTKFYTIEADQNFQKMEEENISNIVIVYNTLQKNHIRNHFSNNRRYEKEL